MLNHKKCAFVFYTEYLHSQLWLEVWLQVWFGQRSSIRGSRPLDKRCLEVEDNSGIDSQLLISQTLMLQSMSYIKEYTVKLQWLE